MPGTGSSSNWTLVQLASLDILGSTPRGELGLWSNSVGGVGSSKLNLPSQMETDVMACCKRLLPTLGLIGVAALLGAPVQAQAYTPPIWYAQ
jgi:hypothetical protein